MNKRIMAACGPLYHRLEKKTNKSSFCWRRRRQGAKGGRIAQFFAVSKTSHRDVFDGQPVRPPGTGPAGFSAPNGCRRLSPKDPPPLVQGAALGAGRKASFFLFLSQKERSKEKCSLRKKNGGVSPSAEGDQRLCLWTPPPFGKGGRKLWMARLTGCVGRWPVWAG